jgi:maltokinase
MTVAVAGRAGAGAAGASADVARQHAPELVTAGRERPITVDQTNSSVVVDDAVIVKWLLPPVDVAHRIAVVDHLREVGFSSMPAYFGAEEHRGRVVATVSEFVGDTLDGWDWFVDAMTGYADGVVGRADVVADAERIGSLAGDLHVALTTPSSVVPRPVADVETSIERDRCRALLAEALASVTDDEARVVLDVAADRIRRRFDVMPTGPTPACMLHGDLHVGQFLKSRTGQLLVTDFDGNPLVAVAERGRLRPLAVDVASLVQSIDHAGRVAQRRRPAATGALDALIAECAQATVAAHAERLRAGDRLHLFDDRLFGGLRAAQELHELVYSARHLPRWSYAPTATLAAMFPPSTGVTAEPDASMEV